MTIVEMLSTEPRAYDCSVMLFAPKCDSFKCSRTKATASSLLNVSHKPSLANIRNCGLQRITLLVKQLNMNLDKILPMIGQIEREDIRIGYDQIGFQWVITHRTTRRQNARHSPYALESNETASFLNSFVLACALRFVIE